MVNETYYYLLLNFLTILFPFAFSFEKRIRYYRQWVYVIPAITTTAAFFIFWDYFFTRWNVWSFNPAYITGRMIGGLPIEEILFFFCIPYACMFMYVIIREIFVKPAVYPFARVIAAVAGIISFLCALAYAGQLYTSVTFLIMGCVLVLLFFNGAPYLFTFLLTYFVQLIPFLLVNGILTSMPVVEYNPLYFSGVRFYSIPAEDFLYSALLLLMNVTIYEGIKNSRWHPLSN